MGGGTIELSDLLLLPVSRSRRMMWHYILTVAHDSGLIMLLFTPNVQKYTKCHKYQNMYIYMLKHFYSDYESPQKISFYRNLVAVACSHCPLCESLSWAFIQQWHSLRFVWVYPVFGLHFRCFYFVMWTLLHYRRKQTAGKFQTKWLHMDGWKNTTEEQFQWREAP